MPKNKEFKDALESLSSSTATTDERNKALDALLKVAPNDPVAFRAALFDDGNIAFWDQIKTSDGQSLTTVPPAGWIYSAPTPEVYIKSSDFLDNTADFKSLHQLAAEQRVKLSLADADTSVLVGILTHNPEEVRAYLATRTELFDLNSIHGWQPSIEDAVSKTQINKSDTVLTDGAIKTIQAKASELLLRKLIQETQDLTQLDKLLVNTGIKSSDLKEIHYPTVNPDVVSAETLRLIRADVEERKAELNTEAAKAGMDAYIKGLDEQKLNSFDTALKSDDLGTFSAQLDEPYKTHLSDVDLKLAKRAIGTRYLQSELPKRTAPELLPALRAPDNDQMKAKLEKLKLATNYLEIDATDEDCDVLRKSLLHGVFTQYNKDELNNLISLSEPRMPLDKYKTELKNKLGLNNTSWIKDSDLGDLKSWARHGALLLILEKASPYGAKAHPQLIATFDKLSVEKQRKLLTDPLHLLHLLDAQDDAAVSLLLGRDTEGAALLAAENQSVSPYKKIQNAEVAKVLFSLQSIAVLNKTNIDSINHYLTAFNLTDDSSYIQTVHKVVNEMNVANPGLIYQAFDLTEDGISIRPEPHVVNDAICSQYCNNKVILDQYNVATPPNKNILSLLLCLDIDKGLNKEKLNSVLEAFHQAQTIDELRSKLKDDPKGLRIKLIQNLSVDTFKEIKAAQAKAQLEPSNAPKEIKERVAEIRAKVLELKKDRKSLTANAGRLENLLKITDMHLLNPAFQGKAREESEEMLTHFETLAKQCDLVVNKLRREIETLESYKKSIPDRSIDKSVIKLRDELVNELKSVKADLKKYEEIQTRLHADNGILKTVTDAAEGKTNYLYKPEHFSVETVLLSEIDDELKIVVPQPGSSTSAVVRTGIKEEPMMSELVGALSEGQARVHHFAQRVDDKSQIVLRGSFTEQYVKKKTSSPEGKFEVREFPEKQKGVSETALQKARVEFSMAMAVQALSSLDKMPTEKDKIGLGGNNAEQLAYLYTALITLGVDKKAIKVNSSAFDPESQHGALWGFRNDSIKSRVFDTHKSLVNQGKAEMQKVRGIKSDEHGVRKEAKKSASTATNLFKEKNEALKKARKELDQEGPAPKRLK